MISFRYHLVSITAFFLALALGIAMGATVVDRATVALLEERLADVEQRADRRFADNRRLTEELAESRRFVEELGDEAVRGRLAGVPVVLVVARGAPGDAVSRLRTTLEAAQAALVGTVWLMPPLDLAEPDEVERLQTVLEAEPGRPDELRRAALTRLATAWATPGREGTPLPALIDAGFLEYEVAAGQAADPATLPPDGARFVVAAAAGAEVAVEPVATGTAAALARAGHAVVAADLTAEAEGEAPFAAALRNDVDVAGRMSTVDNADEREGRTAVALALVSAGSGRFGHYGTAPRADRLVPEPAP